MKRLALALCLAALAAPPLDAQDARPAAQTGASAADSEWTLLQATDWPTRARGLIGKRVEVFGNLSVDPSSGFSSTGVMTGRFRSRIVATVSFDRIGNEQVTWMTENKCLLTCRGVFVRGVVVMVGAAPVLQMIDISFKSRADGVDSTVALAAPALNVEAAPATQTGGSAEADSGWTLVQASEWRTRAPGLIGRRVELSGDLSTQFYVDPHESFSNTGEMRGTSWRDPLATVLFDQISTEQARWFRTNKCLETCVGVFVRGIVLSERPGRMCGAPPQPRCSETPPVLRMTDISFNSRAGGVAASMVQLDSARDRDAGKPLLPPGAVPNKDATSAVVMGGVEAPTPTAATDTVKKKKGGLLGTLKAMGFTATVGSGRKRQKAGPAEGMFMYGDPPLLETYYRNIRDTQLYRVFANSPWNTGQSMWPRVAFVVEDAAQGGANSITPYTKGGDELRNRCWRLSARLWTGPAASRDIPSFNWCLTEMHYDVLPDPGGGAPFIRTAPVGMALWGMTPKVSMSDKNTGPERTMGPNPPYTPVMRFHFRDEQGAECIMLGNLLREMAFEFGVPDGRVWVVTIPGQ